MKPKLEWEIEEHTTYSMECNFCWRTFENDDEQELIHAMKDEFTYAYSDDMQAIGWACSACMAHKDNDLKAKNDE